MFERIIVGTDGSDRSSAAIEYAARLALDAGAALHLVQGCGSPIVVAPIAGNVAPIDPSDLAASCANELGPVADALRARGIDVTVHVSATNGPDALCTAADELLADLIVVGNRGMTGAKRLLGSVPNSVAHRAPCPVLVVPTG